MTLKNFVTQAIYAAMKDAQFKVQQDEKYLPPPDPEQVDSPDKIDVKLYVDVDSTSPVRRKVLEWTVNNVSTFKTVPNKKERAVRELIAHGINNGWTKKKIQERLQTEFDIKAMNAKRIALNEVRRAYNWAYRKTGYELGYRTVVWRVHPGACKKICAPRNGLMLDITLVSIPEDSHPGCRCWLELNRTGFVTQYKKTMAPLPILEQAPGFFDIPNLLDLPEWFTVPRLI